jgi:HEAT repeat protein
VKEALERTLSKSADGAAEGVRALRELKSDAIPPLFGFTRDRKPEIRRAANEALRSMVYDWRLWAKLEDGIGDVAAAFGDQDEHRRRCAAETLKILNPGVSRRLERDPDLVMKLRAALSSPEAESRECSTVLLGQDRRHSADLTGEFIALLRNDPVPEVRRAAAYALNRQRPEIYDQPRGRLPRDERVKIATALIEALKDPAASVRAQAADAVGDYPFEEVRGSVSALVKALGDEDDNVREGAQWSLRFAGPHPDLVRAVGHEKAPVRRTAVRLVGEAIPREPGLLLTLTSGGHYPTHRAAGIKALAGALRDPDDEVRRAAIMYLTGVGKAAVPHVIEVLKGRQNDPASKVAAAQALAGYGANWHDLAPLIEALSGSDDETRGLVVGSLVQVARGAPWAAERLRSLQLPEQEAQKALRQAIERLDQPEE